MGKRREISVPALPVPSSCQVCLPLWSARYHSGGQNSSERGVARPPPTVFWVPERHWHWEPGLGLA